MDEEGAVENVNGKIEKWIKTKSKKDKKHKECTSGIHEALNIGTMEATEFVQFSENEDIAEIKDRGRGQEKKKSKGIRDAKADIEKGLGDSELTDVYGGDGGGPTMDNVARKRKKREKKKNKNDKFEMGDTEEVEGNGSKMWPEGESLSRKKSGKEAKKEQRKQEVKMSHVDGNFEGEKEREVIATHSENCEVNAIEMNKKKKKKKDRRKSKDNNINGSQDSCIETKHDVGNDSNGRVHTEEIVNKEVEYVKKKKKKKTKYVEDVSSEGQKNEVEYANKGKRRKSKLAENGPDDITPSKSNKKVRFSAEVEVFPLPGDFNTEKGNDEEENLVRGKRFTREEDEIVKEAVLNYIEEHELGEEGLDMVLNSRKYPKLKGCWKEIGSSIPYRPYVAVYQRAHILFMRSENRKWTQEEYDQILKFHEEHGNQWTVLAAELGKHCRHVNDTWRRIKLRDMNKGHWSQEEYQKLFDLVNTDLQLKLSEEKKSKHGMLRDNIGWTTISDELSTRAQAECCRKWYRQLTSPMVAEGVWADVDDYHLIGALYSIDATCIEDVDWDDLVNDRCGDLCRKRWNQMALHIGHNRRKTFAEQVEVLAQRYCPHLLDARKAWDSKPRVP